MRKSHIIGFILTLVFGPFGLYYSSVILPSLLIAGFLVCLIVITEDFSTSGELLLWFCGVYLWAFPMALSFFLVRTHNRRAKIEEQQSKNFIASFEEKIMSAPGGEKPEQ